MKGGARFVTNGADKEMRANIQRLRRVTLTVGIHRGKENEGVDVATYGAWNNFGTSPKKGHGIPKRPFMEYSAERIFRWMQSAAWSQTLNAVAKGRITPEQAIRRIGAKAVAITRKTILDSYLYKPNSPRTIMQKGSTKPLVRSGVMIQMVNYKKG